MRCLAREAARRGGGGGGKRARARAEGSGERAPAQVAPEGERRSPSAHRRGLWGVGWGWDCAAALPARGAYAFGGRARGHGGALRFGSGAAAVRCIWGERGHVSGGGGRKGGGRERGRERAARTGKRGGGRGGGKARTRRRVKFFLWGRGAPCPAWAEQPACLRAGARSYVSSPRKIRRGRGAEGAVFVYPRRRRRCCGFPLLAPSGSPRGTTPLPATSGVPSLALSPVALRPPSRRVSGQGSRPPAGRRPPNPWVRDGQQGKCLLTGQTSALVL